MKYFSNILHFIVVIVVAVALIGPSVSCKKMEPDANAKLSFSTMQLSFDTVFTSVGSVTKRFTVINEHNFPVNVSVRLAGGKQSLFSINVDGVAGPEVDDVEIAANDSMFVHVKVNVNPGNQNTPFLVTDSIIFMTGNVTQDVDLLAFGQDANFIIADKWLGSSIHYKVVAGENETVTWTNEKPYVVYGWAVVDSVGKLIIEEGTKIYFHSGGGLWVYKDGNLQVNGTAENPVRFCGDRTQAWYDTDYAQWDRILINEGQKENVIQYAEITNSYIGIQLDTWTEPTYNNNKIQNCVIHNTAGSGVLARASKMEMTNCQISNNGVCGLQLETGLYYVNQATIANYFSQSVRKNPAVFLANSYTNANTGVMFVGDLYTRFTNCIVYGSLENEVVMKKYTDPTLMFDNRFDHCLLRCTSTSEYFVDCKRNMDPKFTKYKDQDFTLQAGSPAIDAGKTGLGIACDITGAARDASPDMGAYEYSSSAKFVFNR
ncbi:MAG: right-handed parallel beta-helix repeat-containing protein [Bacteroidales bacterium]|nr:right-handed parallel beta-helix repeat-containing protein [Bacteroidales bacterium]